MKRATGNALLGFFGCAIVMKNDMNLQERVAAHQWIVNHPEVVEKHIGEWIAVTPSGLLTSNASLQKVSDVLEAKKTKALLFRVPDPNVVYLLGGQSPNG